MPGKKRKNRKRSEEAGDPGLDPRKRRRRERRKKRRERRRERERERERGPEGPDEPEVGPGGIGPNESEIGKYIPDSSLGERKFHDEAGYFLDEARLDPADDPTLQAYVESVKAEAAEDFDRSISDLQAQQEGAGRLGGSYYEGVMQQARDEHDENISNTIAGIYSGAREAALGRKMAALGLGNQRDIAGGQIKAEYRGQDKQLEAARLGAAASRASAAMSASLGRAQLSFERQKWNEQAPLMYMDSLSNLFGNLDQMGGYGLSPGYIPDPVAPGGPNSGAIAAGSIAAGLGAYGQMGGKGYLGKQVGPG